MLAAPRPALEGRQPPRLAMEDTKVPIRGLIALIALLALILLALLRLFTIPSVSHRDLSRLSRLSRLFCIFLLAPLQVTVPQGLKSLRENLPGPGLSPTHHSFCYTGNKCWVPHLPRFPAEACGVDILHAPFLNERRTRDPL
jgi:hypothetical protein